MFLGLCVSLFSAPLSVWVSPKLLLGSSSYLFNKWLVSRKYHRIGLHKSALEAHLYADIMLFGQSICIFYCSKLCTVCFWNEWDNYVKIRVYSLTFLCIIFILKRLLIFNTETTRCSWSDVFNTILLADPEIWKGWGAEDNVSAPVVIYHKCTYWTIWTIPVLDGKKRKKTESNRVGDRHCLWNWLTKFASITCASVSELRLFFWLSATTLHLRHLFDMFAFIFQLLAHTTQHDFQLLLASEIFHILHLCVIAHRATLPVCIASDWCIICLRP